MCLRGWTVRSSYQLKIQAVCDVVNAQLEERTSFRTSDAELINVQIDVVV